MRVTGTLQREAWLRKELPPVERVASGVWSVPVPIPDNPLRYVLSYLIEHQSGFVLVDPGWDAPASWQALSDGLAACSVPLSAVTAVLVTHVHPDHHGLSGKVREASGAWIGMHEGEDALLARFARAGHARRDGRLPALVRGARRAHRAADRRPGGAAPTRRWPARRWCGPTG